MGNKKHIGVLLAAILLLSAAVLAVRPVIARYRTEQAQDLHFEADPQDKLTFSKQDWSMEGDRCQLTFALSDAAEGCVLFLAVSEGIVDPETIEVQLMIPGEEALTARCSPIPTVSALEKLFGAGYVYAFYDPEDTEQKVFYPAPDEQYVLTITGLGSAAEAASLMRLFAQRIE